MSRLTVVYPRLVILLVIGCCLLAVAGLRRGLELDASAQSFIEQEGQAMADYRSARKYFGSDDFIIAAVVADDIFQPENLERLKALHDRIAGLDGVAEVLSLRNVPYARSIEGGASLETLLPATHSDLDRLAEAKAIATHDRLYAGNIVSGDCRTAALNILLDPDLTSVRRHLVTRQIYEFTRAAGFPQSYFAGDPFSQWRGVQAIKRDLSVFLPLTVIMIAVLLWRSFRSPGAVVLPLLTIGIGLLWLLGLMAAFGANFTILALMLPTLMLAIGCSYMIHVINQVGLTAEARDGTIDKSTVIEEAVRFISLPVIVSALTIMAGFLSLAFTPIPAIKETAVYAAIGAAMTMVLSLTFIPACLVLLPGKAITFRVGLGGATVGLLERVGHWATTHQGVLYLATGLIVLVSVVGMWRIQIDIDYFHFFKPNSETSIGLAEINRRLSGAVTFDLVVEGKRPEEMADPSMLLSIERLQLQAENYRDASGRGIDRTLSVADFVKHLHRAFRPDKSQTASFPSEPEVVEELLSDRDQLRGFLSSDGRVARILIRSNLSGSQSMAAAIRELERQGQEIFPGLRVYATGAMVLLNRSSDRIAGEQRQSITIALVTIFAMLAILFRSVRVGLTALVPNLIPILFFFGFMGWGGIPLNLTTSLVASVVLGLAVDNAVQFIVRFRRLQKEHSTLAQAIIGSLRFSGRPIIYANIALAATFAIFALSNFQPIGSFGLLSAVTILGCLVEDLILLPARLTSPVFRAH